MAKAKLLRSFNSISDERFEELKDIAKVNVLFEQAGEWQYTIRVSKDGVSWNNYAENPTGIPREQEYGHEITSKARYVSIDITSGGLDPNGFPCWASIWEMSVLDAEGNNLYETGREAYLNTVK